MTDDSRGPKQRLLSGTSIYQELGVRTIINGRGATTSVGGTIMVPAAVEAMMEGSREFVVLDELNAAVGRRIAEVTGAEEGYVTAGSAAGMALAAAACITGSSAELIGRLPDTSGIPNEIIIQREHRLQYDQMYRVAGGVLVEIGGPNGTELTDLTNAVGPNTVAVTYHDSPACEGLGLDFSTYREFAHSRGLPVIVDAASTLPPVNHLRHWVQQGADLVIYSGGKGIRGPQDSGILTGRRDLIQAARMNGSPHAAIGRGMKVSKEAMVGLWAAIEDFLSRDHQAEFQFHLMQAKAIEARLSDRADTRCELESDWERWPAPVVRLFPNADAWSPEDVRTALIDGEPSIHVNVERDGLMINTHCLRSGEEVEVGERLCHLIDEVNAVSGSAQSTR